MQLYEYKHKSAESRWNLISTKLKAKLLNRANQNKSFNKSEKSVFLYITNFQYMFNH